MPASFTVREPARLLEFLFASCPEVKKTKVRQWLKHGGIQVNGRSTTRFDHPLEPGDSVELRGKEQVAAEAVLPPGMVLIFEDEALLVVEKPERLLSVATEAERKKTAFAFVTEYLRRGDPESRERAWMVHRLDREISGLMVFVKSEPIQQTLQAEWNKAEKRFMAVVEGHPPEEKGTLSSHLDEGGPFRVYSAPPSERTRYAETHYRVVRSSDIRALVEVSLERGRRNQVRVHLADAGCPVVGDKKYEATTDPIRRLALHASFLEFKHPLTSKSVQFESPLPVKLAGLVPPTKGSPRS